MSGVPRDARGRGVCFGPRGGYCHVIAWHRSTGKRCGCRCSTFPVFGRRVNLSLGQAGAVRYRLENSTFGVHHPETDDNGHHGLYCLRPQLTVSPEESRGLTGLSRFNRKFPL